MTLQFDVNNASQRDRFLSHQLMEVLNRADINLPALWGSMSLQHMVEHLVWTFNASVGLVTIQCDFSESRQQQMKQFIYSNMETPRQFKNPLLPAHPLPLKYADLSAARIALSIAVSEFFDYYQANTEATHTHPLFGRLEGEDWERVHYKHCFHHLLQFGLISRKSDLRT